jgi:hypothetical protein
MGTTNIILGIGFAALSALIATLILEVRALRSLALDLNDAQTRTRDEMVTRGIRALRAALDRTEDDLPRSPASELDDDDEATMVRRQPDDDERTSPLSGRVPTWPSKK